MANLDTPFGLKPVKHLMGAPWNGKVNTYYVPVGNSTAMFVGDAVVSDGTADATGKFPGITQATAGANIRGVVVGFGDNPYTMIHPDTPLRNHCPATTAMYAFVVDDPFVIFEMQEDSGGAALAITAVGLSTNIVVGSGSTATGKSAMELDSSDTGTDTTGQCKLLRVVDREDNALGTNCKWEILIVEHELLTATDV